MNPAPTIPANAAQRRAFWFFVLMAVLVLGAGIGLRDPWPSDEPRFALAAKQMVETGNWLIPHRGSELYADKPPTFMVLQAAAYELVGNWRIAFLLPSLLAGLGTLLLVYDLARRLWNRETGLFAAGALLTTFQFVYQAKRAQIDPTVTFFITLANYGLLRHFLLGPDWRAYWLGCFAAGLGVITKGVGVLALFMFAPYLVARARGWRPVAVTRHAAWRWSLGAFVFLLAVALWLGPMLLAVYRANSPQYAAYAHDILFHQTAGRYTDSWDHGHPWWYYLGVMVTGWLPLTLALPWAWPDWRKRIADRDATLLLPLAWIVLIVIFFSVPRGKRDVYIMPALPMFALCLGPQLRDIAQRAGFKRATLALIALLGTVFLVVGVYALAAHPPFAMRLATQRGLVHDGAVLWWLLIALGAWPLACAAWFRARRGVHALLSGLFGMWMLWSFWAYPVLNASSSAAGVMRRADAMLPADAHLALVGWKEQNLLMAGRPVTEFGFVKPWPQQMSEAIRWQEADPQKRWVFVRAAAMQPCVAQDKAIYVGHANRREWWLFRDNAVAPECRGGRIPSDSRKSAEDPNAE